MFRFFTLLLISVFISSSLFAIHEEGKKKGNKIKAYKGYVITTKGDTLEGKIEMLSPSLNEVRVKLIQEDGQAIIYRAKDVNSYSFLVPNFDKKQKQFSERWISYVKRKVKRPPVPFGPSEVLMQQEVKGKLNLFNYYIETRSRMTDYDHLVLLEKDGELIEIKKSNYKKKLKKIMMDSPIVVSKIGKKGYRFKNIGAIIKLYNYHTGSTKESLPNVTML